MVARKIFCLLLFHNSSFCRWTAMASSIVYDVDEAIDQNQEVPEEMDFEDLWSNLFGK